jgi:hypothetical protein
VWSRSADESEALNVPDTPPQEQRSKSIKRAPLPALPGPRIYGSYRSHLSEEDQKIYDEMSGDPDLSDEIRLTRTIITKLWNQLEEQEITINQALALLCRCITLQLKSGNDASGLEQYLLDQGEQVLIRIDAEAR